VRSRFKLLLTLFKRCSEVPVVKGETRERWQHLCELAADEQDPEKLLELVKEINRLLEAKEARLQMLRKAPLEEKGFKI
jgi:hypothetical protein